MDPVPYPNWADRLRVVRRLIRRFEVAQVKRFGRSALSIVFRTPVLVLRTTGRKSGRDRETRLAYLRLNDETLLVVGGAGGQTRLPDWVANVREYPIVMVVIGKEVRPMFAIELTGRERECAWERAVAQWPQIENYERRAGRAVPVVRLTLQAA